MPPAERARYSSRAKPAHAHARWRRCRRAWQAGRSILLFLKGRAKRVRRIDAKNLELAREELQLFHRKGEPPIVRVALDIGVEHGGEEIALDHVAFELGHVHAVGGEATHRF